MIVEKIYKKILPNGLAILVVPSNQIPKVSVQLWYNVGSKDETTSQKGIAHFIEHMIFKGTKTLSETDINRITQKLSGYSNAFTSHDYTGYLFDFPSQHWYEALPIMADCMENSVFKQELLNSELKAIIQELKMYNDDHAASLIEVMMGTIFQDHPYHYPIIGYKRDLWNLDRETLVEFYKHYYVPNNASLIVVGDVDPEDVFIRAERAFGHIEPEPSLIKEQFYHAVDIGATHVDLYRDVQQSTGVVAWLIPGMRSKQDYMLDLMSWIIGQGKGSRLYTKLVDEMAIATSVDSFIYDLFDYSILFVQFTPKEGVSVEQVTQVLRAEISRLVTEGFADYELVRAVKKTEMDMLALRENNQKRAYIIGKYFIALGDESYLSCYNAVNYEELPQKMLELMRTYLRSAVMHSGSVLPLPAEEKLFWVAQQEQSDRDDEAILSQITRDADVEDGSHVANIVVEKPKDFTFPKPEIVQLSNGIKVLVHHTTMLPKIDLILDFKAKHYMDPDNRQGLMTFLYDSLDEGTEHYTAQQLAQEFERYGMSFDAFAGHMSMTMLSVDIEHGLNLLTDIVKHASLEEKSIEKVRDRLMGDVVDFWDDPVQFSTQLTRECIYKNHPYSKRILGTVDSVRAITRQEVYDAYKKWITPQGTRLALVGDLSNIDVQALLEQTLGTWSGPQVEDIVWPKLVVSATPGEVNYPINRDQTVLCFGRLSVDRLNPDFDKLLLFDQIFTGGVLGGMNSKLFLLRERSGLFYAINGSLLAGSGRQPGMAFIKTIVSNDRLAQAEKQIKQVIDEGAKTLTQIEHEEAQRAVLNALVDNFATTGQMASTFLYLDYFGLPANYFDHRAEALLAITPQEVQKSAEKYLHADTFTTVRVGRIKG